MKKIVSIFLAVVIFALTFASCGSKKDGEETTAPAGTTVQTSGKGFTIGDKDHIALGTPEKTLDPQTVYSKVKYTPEMFRGEYRLLGGIEARKTLAENSDFMDVTYDGMNERLATLPWKFVAGENSMSHKITSIEGYNWATLYFETEDGGHSPGIFCDYKIKGNKIIFTPLSDFTYDKVTGKYDYTFSEKTFEYDFAFNGRNLTLTLGDKSNHSP